MAQVVRASNHRGENRCQTRSHSLFGFAWRTRRGRSSTTKLEEVFSHIVKEPTFIEASFLQDMLDPQNLVVHEEWFESPDSFMRNQMTKPYRAAYEKMVVDRKIERTPAWYSTILEWKKA
jgi:quinol monooxygenase YgiN